MTFVLCEACPGSGSALAFCGRGQRGERELVMAQTNGHARWSKQGGLTKAKGQPYRVGKQRAICTLEWASKQLPHQFSPPQEGLLDGTLAIYLLLT